MAKVVKLAQPGFDVRTADDVNLIYNSNWPLLKIYKSGSHTFTDFTKQQVIATHDLGYVPMFWYFSNAPEARSATFINNSNSQPAQRSEYKGPLDGSEPLMSDTQFWYNPNSDPRLSGTVTINYYIFALDILKPYQAPISKSGTQTAGKSEGPVFKVAKSDKDVKSTSLEDYVIHSDARSPLIHSVNPGQTTPDSSFAAGYSLVNYHNLGYIPIFFPYKEADGFPKNYQINTAGLVNNLFFNIDETKISYIFFGPVNVTSVILKDPFQIDNIANVTI